MAQAARLSLRMQKEVKLLLTDPPPGASFPSLSPLSDSSLSLSSLLADIEGPEGTVYEKGLFRLNIQIPERYPFQPPVVTFSTPIYHPNIDNGGRICLDILNLPPKGAWQPSLNISTVLTSIGLLLSEPNPDDGLMCEVSKEYKYNRHVFDQKARSMTEKLARAGNRDSICSKNSQAQSSTSMVEAKCEIDEDYISNKKFKVNGSKLSLECTKTQQYTDINDVVNEKTTAKIEWPKEVCQQMVEDSNQHKKKLSWTKRKLSLGSLGLSEQKVDDETETLNKNQHSSFLNTLNVQKEEVSSHFNGRSSDGDDDVAMVHNSEVVQKDFAKKTDNYLNISKPKKLGLSSKRLSLPQQTDNKENTNPVQSFPFSYTDSLQLKENRGNLVLNSSKNMGEKADSRTEHEPLPKLSGSNNEKQDMIEEPVLPDAVIVLDSEDSEEESKRPVRSRLMLARKRLPCKSKPKVKC